MDELSTTDGLLRGKARWVWEQTLLIHKHAPETRLASSLSAVEIFVALYYGGILKFRPSDPLWDGRDRVIVSKGHGSISMYPILADLGFIERSSLERVCEQGSSLGAIPDPIIPGYETVNGSLGHGPGVGCGMALGLKLKGSESRVFVVVGDGELYEGAVWEAVMFAGHHRLDNLTMIVDNNGRSLRGDCKTIIDLSPLDRKFREFRWEVAEVDGHDVMAIVAAMRAFGASGEPKPKLLIANTVKGKGVPRLETNPLSHVMSLKPEEIDELIGQG